LKTFIETGDVQPNLWAVADPAATELSHS